MGLNALVERQNRSIHRGLLNAYLFNSLAEVRMMAGEWRIDYNYERPHKSLGYLSPFCYAESYYQSHDQDLQLYSGGERKSIKNGKEPIYNESIGVNKKL